MARYYSNQYGTYDGGTTYIYKGPGVERKGQEATIYGTITFDGNFGAGDDAVLCDLPEGARITRLSLINTTDQDTDNDLTVDIGWASDQDEFATASTGLQATTIITITETVLISADACAAGDKLTLTRIAGELEAAGSLRFIVAFVVP